MKDIIKRILFNESKQDREDITSASFEKLVHACRSQ